MIRIDGSVGEGGGQILRTALSLSACLATPFEIVNIRKNRKKPGLLPQHLTSVNAVAKICSAETIGARYGSASLIFKPNQIIAGEYEFDVAQRQGSAGAVTLIGQAILPVLLGTKSRIIIKGGTHVPYSPPYDFLSEVLIKYLNQFGHAVHSKLINYGFFPVGQGKIVLDLFVTPLNKSIGVVLSRGGLKKLSLISRVANLPLGIAERQTSQFVKLLAIDFPLIQVEEKTEQVRAACPGTYVFLKAEFENITTGFCALGERGKPAEQVSKEVYQEFKSYLLQKENVYDSHLADQIGIFLALSRFRNGNKGEPFIIKTNKTTAHLATNIWLIRQFLPGYQPVVQTSVTA
jgi:RNA 3'-terminal phosphate cyclase (ATP)